ncbi:MAG: hypothetical protein K5668_10315 [Lachnospiraceae bacterium]|nr:hypothetical protein [Lachnospiraceae bacterium]
MNASVIRARLDLLVRLIDTTTGALVEERNLGFMRNGEPVKAEMRSPGTYVFINTGREDFLMHISVYGYEDKDIQISYGELDERLPVENIFLMPSENVFTGEAVLSFSGTLPFLKTVEAVNLNRPACICNEYDQKNNVMKVFRTGAAKTELFDIYYGLLHADKSSYEKTEVTGNTAPQSVQLKETLQEEFTPNSPLHRVVFGSVTPEGEYLLRIRDDAEELKYLVRYTVGDEVRFQTVDFRNMEALL